MRGIACIVGPIVLAMGCRPAPKPAPTLSTAVSAESNSGTIPITSRSVEAVVLFVRGRTLNENLQPHEAYALFHQAVALDPTFAMGEYGLASTAPTAKQVRQHLDSALALSPNASQGEQLLIHAMRSRLDADPVAVTHDAESLVRHYPRDERAHWVLGNAYGAQQSYIAAIAQYQQAISISPQYSLAYNSLGYAYRSAGNDVAAEHAFLQYIALVPNDPNPYDSYAELLMKLGRFDESITQYRNALSIDPHFSGSFVGIAANHMFAGRYGAAIAEADRYFTVARDDHERRAALLTLALVNVDNGATDAALRAMDRGYDVARDIGDTLSMSIDVTAIADVLLAAGRIDSARTRYQQARALVAASSLSAKRKQDEEILAHYRIARVSLANHDTATARAEAAQFSVGAATLRNGDRNRQAHELNGLVALEAHQFEESLVDFSLADQQNPEVLYGMAGAYAGLGNRERAAALMTSALQMYTLPTLPHVFVRSKAKVHDSTRFR